MRERIEELARKVGAYDDDRGIIIVGEIELTKFFNEAIELAARECEKKVTPSYQGGGVAIDSENYAVKSCAAAIRKLKVES